MHHCTNTRDWTDKHHYCSGLLSARQPQPAASLQSDPDCRQRVTRGGEGNEAFWKPGQNQTQRLGEELPGVAGVRLQTQSLLLLLREQISGQRHQTWMANETYFYNSLTRFEYAVQCKGRSLIKSQTALHNDCPPGLLHKY